MKKRSRVKRSSGEVGTAEGATSGQKYDYSRQKEHLRDRAWQAGVQAGESGDAWREGNLEQHHPLVPQVT